jgi:DUF971 family protein
MTGQPIDIKAQSARRILRVQWADDHVSEFPYKYLRCQCGCAICVDERTGIRRLNPDDVPENVEVAELQLVGHYAMQITWSDQHDTGIYSWDYLMRLCPCDSCGGPKPLDRRVSPH